MIHVFLAHLPTASPPTEDAVPATDICASQSHTHSLPVDRKVNDPVIYRLK